MNRLILKHGVLVTIVIMMIFAWVIVQRLASGGPSSIILLVSVAVPVWVVGTAIFIFFWPRITVGGFKRIFTKRGMGGGPIPVNTLYAVPLSSSQSATSGSVLATGTDDVLHVPAMEHRYYSIQFTDPRSGANFAYVGTRTTGSAAGAFFLSAQGWNGDTPAGMIRIDVPHHAALLIGRVFVVDERDRGAAYALARQFELSPPDLKGGGPRAEAS